MKLMIGSESDDGNHRKNEMGDEEVKVMMEIIEKAK